MSVDQRLREAFHADDDWVPEVALSTVQHTARRESARRRAALAVAAAVVLAAGAVVATTRIASTSDGIDPADPSPTSSATPAPTDAPLAFEDTWVSAPLTESRVRVVLERAGLAAWADEVVAELRPVRGARLVLRLERGNLDLRIKRRGAEMEPLDLQTYVARAGLLELTPRTAEGRSQLDWNVSSEGELTFDWRSTTEPDLEGVPAEAYIRVVYTAVPFTPGG